MIRLIDHEYLKTSRASDAERCAVVGKPVTFGLETIDRRIGGGLMRRALHEVFALSVEDASAAAAFVMMLVIRANLTERPTLWIRERRCSRNTGHLYATGLVELGGNPDTLVMIEAPDAIALLRAGADAAKCDQVGAVVIEPWGKAPLLDLTASRRLSTAAAASGALTLILRVDAQPAPSAAQTRWQVSAAPSSPLDTNAPGHTALDIALLRHRGGIAGFETSVEWNRDTRSFAPLSGGVPVVPAVGADQARPFNRRNAA